MRAAPELTPAERQTLLEGAARGERVRKILNDADFVAARQQLEMRYFREWRLLTDSSLREELWAKLHALDDIVRELNTVIGTGDVAHAALERVAQRGGTQ
jgi:hypothetical protein